MEPTDTPEPTENEPEDFDPNDDNYPDYDGEYEIEESPFEF